MAKRRTPKKRVERRPRKSGAEKLNERERRFVEYFMGEAAGNAARAARLAGYSEHTSRQAASRLLTKVIVQDAIEKRRQKAPEVASRVDRQAFWTRTMNNVTREMRDRLKASELLGRSQADFVEIRMAPVVSDPHASEEQLIDRVREFLATADKRAAEGRKGEAKA